MSFSSKFYSLDKKVLLNQKDLNIINNNSDKHFVISEPKPQQNSNYNPSNYHNKFCNINENNENNKFGNLNSCSDYSVIVSRIVR